MTSTGANSNSFLLYIRTKGRVEQAISAIYPKGLTIYRPGFLENRRNDFRWGEKLGSYLTFLPFISKIESRDMGAAMVERALQQIKEPMECVELLENQQIIDMLA